MKFWPSKAPGEVEDFAVDFSAALEDGESIASKTVTADGVTVDRSSIDGALVTLWLSGGSEGTVAKVVVAIVTDTTPARTYSETCVLEIGGEAIALATAKAQQRITDDSEDALLAGMLRAAVRQVETVTGKKLRSRVCRQQADGFPASALAHTNPAAIAGGIRLYCGPVSEILSVEYDDGDGVAQTLTDFRLVEGSDASPARLLPAYGSSWPVTACGAGAVRVSYVAGYDPTELPPELVQAALLLFGHFNANREAVAVAAGSATVAELPLGLEWLVGPYRFCGIA